MTKLRCVLLLLYAAEFLPGQDALTRLTAESVPLRVSGEMDRTKQKDALRDWIESSLPASLKELETTFVNLEGTIGFGAGTRWVGRARNDSVSVYRFFDTRTRLIEARGTHEWSSRKPHFSCRMEWCTLRFGLERDRL